MNFCEDSINMIIVPIKLLRDVCRHWKWGELCRVGVTTERQSSVVTVGSLVTKMGGILLCHHVIIEVLNF